MQVADVTVVIPAYNASWCIEKAISSVLAQTLPAQKIIVVNDGSTDNTIDQLQPFAQQVEVITIPNQGLSHARNTGIEAANTTYVAFLDADDYWHPDKLQAQMGLFSRNPELVFCSTEACIVNEDYHLVDYWHQVDDRQEQQDARPLLLKLFQRNASVPGSGSAVIAKTQALRQSHGFDESLKSLEDIDMWMRLACLGEYACVPRALTMIYRHSNSMSRNLNVMRSAALTVMKKNRSLLPASARWRFWRQCYAGTLIDYAKWEYRANKSSLALWHLITAAFYAPLAHGRLIASLMLAMLRQQQLE